MHIGGRVGTGVRRAGWGVVLMIAMSVAIDPLRAERVELDLYEKISLAPLVIVGRIEGDPKRLADVRVLEVLKGEYAAPTLSIVYRLANFERPYGKEKMEFAAGEEALFFLLSAENSRGQLEHADRFILFKGPDGKVSLPVEGRQVWLDASRQLASLCSIADGTALFDSLRGLIAHENPLLVEIGLRQTRKHKLVDERMVPVLLDLVRRPDSRYRAEALELAAELVRQPAREETPLAARDHLLGLASLLADESPEVATRRAAVRVLASDGTPAARAKLEAISEADPSQDVRYEAAVAVYRLRDLLAPALGRP